MAPDSTVSSVNVGQLRPTDANRIGLTGIDKRPVTGPVEVRAPGPRSVAPGSGLAGDRIADLRRHGGDDQAVYAYPGEDLDARAGPAAAAGHRDIVRRLVRSA